MNLLEGHALRKTYKLGKHNEVHALRGVDVAIGAGEMVESIPACAADDSNATGQISSDQGIQLVCNQLRLAD